MDKEKKLSLIGFIVIAGFAAAELRNYIFGVYLGRPYPWNTYLFLPSERFSDYRTLTEWCSGLNPYFGSVPSGQLPFLNFVAYLFSFFNPVAGPLIFLSLLTLPFLFWSLKVARPLTWGGVTAAFGLTFLNYPLLFTADRGNFEGLLFFCLIGLVAGLVGRRHMLSALFLGVAIALKGFPIVFLPLFAFRKKFVEAGVACAVAALLSIFSFAIFEGGLWANAEFFLSGKGFDHAGFKVFLTNPDTIQRGVSLFSVLKIAIRYLGAGWEVDFADVLRIYKPIAGLMFLPLLWLAYKVRVDFWKSILVIVIAAILLPQLSGHYKLIHLLIPMLLFVAAERAGRYDLVFAILFGLLLIPKPYFMLGKMGSEVGQDLSISVILDPLLMLVMLGLIFVGRSERAENFQPASDM